MSLAPDRINQLFDSDELPQGFGTPSMSCQKMWCCDKR